MAITRREYLQDLADELHTEDQFDYVIEYRPFSGWWALPEVMRYFNDEGEYLGLNWRDAEKTLRIILG